MEQTTKTKRQSGKRILSGFPSPAGTSLHRLFRNSRRGFFSLIASLQAVVVVARIIIMLI